MLTEKPLSVHKADCEKVIAAYEARPDKSKIFSEMFNQREYRRPCVGGLLLSALACSYACAGCRYGQNIHQNAQHGAKR